MRMAQCNDAPAPAGNSFPAGRRLDGGAQSHHNPRVKNLWRSGMVLSAASLFAGASNYLFQILMGHRLPKDEFGFAYSTLAFTGLLGMPVAIATMAIIHYIAHFRAAGRVEHLEGLLAGCRRFLIRLTIAGSVLAVVAAKPLGDYFDFPRASLMLMALLCVLLSLWAGFASALCQGLGWFGRFAIINILAAALRLAFGVVLTLSNPVAEMAVAATAAALLANLVLIIWRKELAFGAVAESPWSREFVRFLVLSAVSVGGGYFLLQGDQLVAQKHLSGAELGDYTAAGLVARALIFVSAPFLAVLFTSRSSGNAGGGLRQQAIVAGLYVLALFCGAVTVQVMREVLVRWIFGKPSPEAAALISQFSWIMVFVGLIQLFGMWALASRWTVVAVLYGVTGVGYWAALLVSGRTLDSLLNTMLVAAAAGAGVLGVGWALALRSEWRAGAAARGA
jgi:O-antigen/teichoic acid export membrane protein